MIKIGDFAKMFDVSLKTIRFYEEKGLLSPALVDVYTGYRYFDEKNIEEMKTILAYKSLGFELSEISNVEDNDILNKIESFKKQINIMNNRIDTLNTLLVNKERGIGNMNVFINDEKAIGKWELVGICESKDEYKKGNLLDEPVEVGLKELYLMDDGHRYWVVSWSKGFIYVDDRACKYEIENDLMYVYLVGLYGEEERVAVYKKIDSKHYTEDDIRIKDNTDVPFVPDNNLVGLWECVGTVETLDSFDPKNIDTKKYLEKLSVFPDGSFTLTYTKGKVVNSTYTKGFFKNFCQPDTMSAYDIDGDYLIVEWKSGDYIYGNLIFGRYVFKKVINN